MLSNLFGTISTFFSTTQGRKLLKDGLPPLSDHPSAIMGDVRKVLEYINTPAYKSWEQEAWAHIDGCMKTILNLNASEREVTLARGQLISALDLLKVSDKALKKQREYEQKQKATSSTPAR